MLEDICILVLCTFKNEVELSCDFGFESPSWHKIVLCVNTSAASELMKQKVKKVTKTQLYAELIKKLLCVSTLGRNSGFDWYEDHSLTTGEDIV